MPTYTCQCKKCGKQADYLSSISNREKSPKCKCGSKTVKIMTAVQISAMVYTGHKGVTIPDGKGDRHQGTWLEDGAAYKQYMKENNVIPYSEGKREAEIKRAAIEAADDVKLTKAVEQAVAKNSI